MTHAATPLELQIGGAPPPGLREEARDLQHAAFVVQLVASYTGIGAREIASTARKCAAVARARQMAMYLVHVAFAWPLGRVAAIFGRDRSTISYACRRVEDLRDDAVFDTVLQRLEGCVRAAPFNGAWA